MFTVDDSHVRDVVRRVTLTETRMGQLRHVFGSVINFKLKMKIYKTTVCSLLTYGYEVWDMDVQTMTKINGVNVRFLSTFTDKDAHAEVSAATRSFNLVQTIRLRRFR